MGVKAVDFFCLFHGCLSIVFVGYGVPVSVPFPYSLSHPNVCMFLVLFWSLPAFFSPVVVQYDTAKQPHTMLRWTNSIKWPEPNTEDSTISQEIKQCIAQSIPYKHTFTTKMHIHATEWTQPQMVLLKLFLFIVAVVRMWNISSRRPDCNAFLCIYVFLFSRISPFLTLFFSP